MCAICDCSTFSIIHRHRVIRMLARKRPDFQDVDDPLEVGAVHVDADHRRKKKNHRRHLMKILVMNQNERKRQHVAVLEVHVAEAANQKNPKNPKYLKRMKKRNCLNQKAIRARYVQFCLYSFIYCCSFHSNNYLFIISLICIRSN